jgi:hypothetical protein
MLNVNESIRILNLHWNKLRAKGGIKLAKSI